VKSYTVILSTSQLPTSPAVLDHYLFLDPILGSSFVYPNTAWGTDYFYTSGVPTVTAYGQNFTPWGYSVQDTYINVSVGPLKGPYTVNFAPTNFDVSTYAITEINYNFGDGSPEVSVTRNFNPTFYQGEALSAVPDPSYTVVSNNYYPLSNIGTTVYTPSITAIYSNLSKYIFNIILSSVPTSIYDFTDIHLINSTQQLSAIETQNIFEIENPNYLTVSRVLSTSTPVSYTAVPFYPTSLSGLSLWLDASDALTVFKNSSNNVVSWNDKSGNNNNFTVVGTVGYNYPRQSSGLRSVRVTPNNYLQTPLLLNSSLGQGYSLFIVARMNNPVGPLFSNDIAPNISNINVSFSGAAPYTLVLKQGSSTPSTVINNISYNLSGSFAAGSNAYTGYSLFSVTLTGSNAYITADSLIIQRANQSYNYFMNSSSPAYIGYDSAGKALADAYFSEVILYNSPLTPALVQQVEQYLINKWNLTLQTN
jgi:hypothetical protein